MSTIAPRSLRLASLNLRKRLNDPKTLGAMQRWLVRVDPEVLLLQEAVGPGAGLPPKIVDMDLVAGDGHVACWAKQKVVRLIRYSDIPAVFVESDSTLICCIYLSAYSSRVRVRQLDALRCSLMDNAKPLVLVGDFNLAPMPMDGRYGDDESKWTSAGERAALTRLLAEIGLVDLTTCVRLGGQQYTFERINKGKWTRFRCDLAFATEGNAFVARYDHEVRSGSNAFTDHSACIVDLRPGMAIEGAPTFSPPHSEPQSATVTTSINVRPHNTAIHRSIASKPVRKLVASGALGRWGVRSILDYGCGHGADVQHLTNLGYAVAGYDPHPDFGRAFLPSDRFDLVLLLYVLNVLPTESQRLQSIRGAARCLLPKGRLLMVARSRAEIQGCSTL